MALFGECLLGLSNQAKTTWYAGHYALAEFLAPPSHAPLPVPGSIPSWQAIRSDLNALLIKDRRQINAGLYKTPVDILPNPIKLLKSSLSYLGDLAAINQRRRRGSIRENQSDPYLPDYYQQNFHFQSDGWASEESAARYDFQVEVLFVGGADAMRRQTLPAIRRIIEAKDNKDLSLTDIACGTGRYLREIRNNWKDLRLTGIDLSRDYLSYAARNTPTTSAIAYQQGMAEKLPLEKNSQDILTSIYLLHEVPREIRREIAQELFRTLKPGGSLILMDSIQIGDHEPYDKLLDRFPIAFHEPYYADYIRDDIEELFEKVGFKLISKKRAFFSTLWEWQKP